MGDEPPPKKRSGGQDRPIHRPASDHFFQANLELQRDVGLEELLARELHSAYERVASLYGARSFGADWKALPSQAKGYFLMSAQDMLARDGK